MTRRGLLGPLFLIAVAAIAIHLHAPPVAVDATAPPAEFSAERAMRHVAAIAGAPRPLGSAANRATQDHVEAELRALGFEVERQRTTIARGWRVARVENVVGRRRGRGGGGAILLAAHLDTVPMSPGAGDAGAAIAAILESVRALGARSPLDHDLIVLFSNPEEIYLHGAAAFLARHSWAEDVRLCINIDPGGVAGPAYVHGTSADNGWLVAQLAAAAPHIISSSVAPDVKRLMHDRSDEFHLFTDAGVAGYNIAFIGGGSHYHTALDRPDRLDRRSLQHLGDYLLPLVDRLGRVDQLDRREPNAIFLNLVGPLFVHYSPTVGWLLVAVAGALWIGNARGARVRGGFGGRDMLRAVAVTLIRSPRGAPILRVVSTEEVRAWSIDGEEVSHRQLIALWNLAPEGVELALEVDVGAAVELLVIDQSYGLPVEPAASQRPSGMMAEPHGGRMFSDATLLSRTFQL